MHTDSTCIGTATAGAGKHTTGAHIRILFAADGSDTSNKALAAAVEMAGFSGGRSVVRLIHVLDELAYFVGLDPYQGANLFGLTHHAAGRRKNTG